MDSEDARRHSSDGTPSKERGLISKNIRPHRRPSVASQQAGSNEKKRNYHGKQKRIDHEKRRNQKKKLKFSTKGRNIDPLNLMGLSQKEEDNAIKIDSPVVGDRGANFEPDNLRPVDATDPLKLKNLEDDFLAVKVNAHKRKRKKRRRRTYSENDKDFRGFYDSMGHEGDTETSENELQPPVKLSKSEKIDMEVSAGSSKLEHEKKMDSNDTRKEDKEMNEKVQKEDSLKLELKEGEAKSKTMGATEMKQDNKEPGNQGQTDQNLKKSGVKFREKDKRFQYGNYNKYYGYRNPSMSEDSRLEYMKKGWFEEKDCLDIGCNVGHLALFIAKTYGPKSMLGVDIDGNLIRSAKNNTRHYVTLNNPQALKQSDFPISFPICHGPLAAPISQEEKGSSFGFPFNVSFKKENYVDFKWETVSQMEQKYDFILCLSVTKWIQLNWGDEGVKKLFKRMFVSLRPGGKLLLEPQPWKSYTKKKNLTPTTRANFAAIKFKPDQYIQYLLSNEVGFATSEKLGIPKHKAQGFQRPMYLLTKGGSSGSETAADIT